MDLAVLLIEKGANVNAVNKVIINNECACAVCLLKTTNFSTALYVLYLLSFPNFALLNSATLGRSFFFFRTIEVILVFYHNICY